MTKNSLESNLVLGFMKILLFTPGMWIYFPAGLADTKVRFIKLERAFLDLKNHQNL